MVKLINNVPCRHVERYESDMEFILLHKILDNKRYQRYYLHTKSTKYRILDNGAFELGKSLDNKKLLEWAKKLNVDEVVAPDVYKNKNKTLDLLQQFIKICPVNLKIMAVPQGKNEKELMECLSTMLNNPRVDVIGLNKLWNRSSVDFNIALRKIHGRQKESHLLGVNHLKDWVVLYNNPYIRSADSRVLSKLVSGKEDTWEEILDSDQLNILDRLHQEVLSWQS